MRLRTIEGQPGTLQIYVTSQVLIQYKIFNHLISGYSTISATAYITILI